MCGKSEDRVQMDNSTKIQSSRYMILNMLLGLIFKCSRLLNLCSSWLLTCNFVFFWCNGEDSHLLFKIYITLYYILFCYVLSDRYCQWGYFTLYLVLKKGTAELNMSGIKICVDNCIFWKSKISWAILRINIH